MQYLTLAVDCGTIRVSISSGISFSSYPSGADIYIIVSGTGRPIYTGFKTPKTISLPAGDYDYILKLSGFEDYAGTVSVSPDEITYVHIDLIPKPVVPVPEVVPVPKPPVLGPVVVLAGSALVLGIILTTTAQKTTPMTTKKIR